MMKLLQKSCLDLKWKPVFCALGCMSRITRGITEQKAECCQGGALCKKCWMCRTRPYVSEHLKENSQNHRHWSKLITNPPLCSSSVHSVNITRRVHCQKTGVKGLNSIQKRWLNTYSCPYRQCITCGSSALLARGNCSVWQHLECRGMRSGRDKVGQSVDEILNPIDRLQQFVAVPLLSEKDFLFRPSVEEVAEAQQLFIPGPKHNIEFLKSAVFEQYLPQYDLPEIAFIGRSNVGKSSLIQMLLSHTDVLVKVSKTAGHTKSLNFFQVGKKFTLVDMPGYGYKMPKHYTASVEHFLTSRKKLSRTFILVDSTVGVTENDVIGLNMLEEFSIPYVVVMTKIDKAKPSTLLRSFMTILKYREKTQHCFPQPFLISSLNGEGVPLLQAFIAYVTGSVNIQGL